MKALVMLLLLSSFAHSEEDCEPLQSRIKPKSFISLTNNAELVSGKVDLAGVNRFVLFYAREIRDCQEEPGDEQDILKQVFGKLTLKWTIDQDGKIAKQERVSSTLNNAEVAKCIEDKTKVWDMPRGPGQVTYTIVFESRGEYELCPYE